MRFRYLLYEQLARIGRAVSNPRRLELLDLLSQAPRTVEALARETGLSVANTSQHLQVLRSARLVETEKQGLYVIYRLADEEVVTFLQSLRALAQRRLAEMEQISRKYLEDPEGLEPVSREDLLERVRRGEVVVLDVRPREEYEAGHLPGAISIPLPELERHLDRLPRDKEIVAYCRGPYCILAVEAVRRLRSRGFRAFRLDDGVWEWRAAGLPVEGEVTKKSSSS